MLVPSSDPHLSEYLPGRWQARQWLSGFTGSMGTLVVTARRGGAVRRQPLLDAGRARARRQRHRAGEDPHRRGGAPPRLARRARAARGHASASTATCSAWPPLARCAPRSTAPASPCAPTSTCSTDAWDDRPALPAAPVWEHLPPEAATPRADKLARVREAMHGAGATHHLVSTVDDVAWLLNLRGSDVDYNPVFLAHAADRPRRRAAVRRRGQGARRARRAARRRRRAPRALRRGRRGARRAARRRGAARRPEARHPRPARARRRPACGWSRRSTRRRC